MPEKQTVQRARRAKAEGKKPTTQAGEFVREEMHHVREGKHGAQSRQQAIAIGLSKARKAGVAVPAKSKRSATKTKRATAKRTSTKRATTKRAPAKRATRTARGGTKQRKGTGTAGKRSTTSRRTSTKGRGRTTASRRGTSRGGASRKTRARS
jgi:hypothetical protein